MTDLHMPTHRFLKVFILILVAPVMLITWAMMCVGERKDVSLHPRRSTGVDEIPSKSLRALID